MRVKSRKVLNKSEKKKLIAGKALDLIINRGLNSITMDDIAKEAGISKGLLYVYFENKDELILSAFVVLVERLKEYILSSLPKYNGKENKIKVLAEAYSNILFEIPSNELMRLFEIMIDSVHKPNRLKELTLVFKDYYGTIMKLWQEIVPSRTIALTVQAMFDGLAIYKAVGVEIPKDKMKEALEYIIKKLST